MNLLNRKNRAEERVYELLESKFQLFNGVFGASDDVLGVIESGVDFEKTVLNTYKMQEQMKKCRRSLISFRMSFRTRLIKTSKMSHKNPHRL